MATSRAQQNRRLTAEAIVDNNRLADEAAARGDQRGAHDRRMVAARFRADLARQDRRGN